MSPAKTSRRSRRNSLELDVQLGASRRGVPHSKRLREWAQAAYLAHINAHPVRGRRTIPPAVVSLRVVTSSESRKLNLAWRGKDKPTNVLSFPVGDEDMMIEEGAQPLGDLAICAQVVAREAKEQGKLSAAHWAHMMVHGVLHLLGYDHATSRDAKVMESIEVNVLRQYGFPDPYQSL
jgi:probable rRNA maturation factor